MALVVSHSFRLLHPFRHDRVIVTDMNVNKLDIKEFKKSVKGYDYRFNSLNDYGKRGMSAAKNFRDFRIALVPINISHAGALSLAV